MKALDSPATACIFWEMCWPDSQESLHDPKPGQYNVPACSLPGCVFFMSFISFGSVSAEWSALGGKTCFSAFSISDFRRMPLKKPLGLQNRRRTLRGKKKDWHCRTGGAQKKGAQIKGFYVPEPVPRNAAQDEET